MVADVLHPGILPYTSASSAIAAAPRSSVTDSPHLHRDIARLTEALVAAVAAVDGSDT